MRISLKAARHNKNMTQDDVAKALGVEKKTVWSWENGRSVPSVDKIDPICRLFGCGYDDIEWGRV